MTITNGVKNKTLMPGVTPIADVVDAPTIGSATAGIESATVTYTAATTGGAATSFTAISTPGSITGSSATSPITVSGLTGGTAYTFKVYGANASGTWSAVQSSASNSVTPTTTAFDSIASSSPSGVSTITFSSIPSTYQHLQIRAFVGNSTGAGALYIRFNGDTTTANYNHHRLNANGSTVFASSGSPDTGVAGFYTIQTTSTYFGGCIVDIHDYKSTSKYKTIRSFEGVDKNGSGEVGFYSNLWMDTTAISSITVYMSSGNYSSGSVVSLYGIKGA